MALSILGFAGSLHAGSYNRETDTRILPEPEAFLFRAAGLFDTGGRLADEATRKHVARLLAAFERWLLRLRAK
jgi:hypothetical protein